MKYDSVTIDTFSKFKNLSFTITKYPNINYSPLERFSQLNINFQPFRMVYEPYLIDIKGTQKKENECFCHKTITPCFQLRDYKIYLCPFAAYSSFYFLKYGLIPPIQPEDFLDITETNLTELHNFCFSKKPICSYCKDDDGFYWNLSKKDNYKDAICTKKAYFLTDYQNYQKRYNDISMFNYIKTNNPNYNNIDINFLHDFQTNTIKRFETNRLDIIIPFYKINKDLVKQLYNNLISQKDNNLVTIYFISDASPYEELVFDTFNNSELNCVFLKNEENQGPGVSRNLGINNSYGDFIMFLDFDDYFYNNSSIKLMLNYIEKYPNTDMFFGYFLSTQHSIKSGERPILISRKAINKYSLEFAPLYFYEDEYFYTNAMNKIQYNSLLIPDLIYVYNNNNVFSLGAAINEFDNKLLYHRLLLNYYSFFTQGIILENIQNLNLLKKDEIFNTNCDILNKLIQKETLNVLDEKKIIQFLNSFSNKYLLNSTKQYLINKIKSFSKGDEIFL